MKANILNVTYAELKKNHFQMALVLTKNLHQYIHKESALKSLISTVTVFAKN